VGRESADPIEKAYDRFGALLYRHALMILADSAAAADVVQNVFLALLRRGVASSDFEERYLRRAVRNECYSWLRRRTGDAFAAEGQLLETIAGKEDRPEERLALEGAIRALPPEQREVLHLHIFEGWTFQEIAESIGESINTVWSRHRYAIEKLRARLTAQAGGAARHGG
jgi:RNA polymerase sigma-70 factor (ECF subfamily)